MDDDLLAAGRAPGEVELGIVDALAQLSFLVQNALARRASAHELSMIQLRLLGVLRDRAPGMAQLAAVLELDKSSVTGLVDRAGVRGLVTRVPSRSDRRVVEVVLTKRGRSLVRRVVADFEKDVARLVAGLTPAQQDQLARLSSRVVADNAAPIAP